MRGKPKEGGGEREVGGGRRGSTGLRLEKVEGPFRLTEERTWEVGSRR